MESLSMFRLCSYNEWMKIEVLIEIGSRLYKELGKMRLKPFASESIGKGAGGDSTFPIDKLAEDIILSGLEKSGEPLTIVSEELGIKDIKGGGHIVLIDPIDGSKNAITGVPFYCASIAVSENSAIGGIYLSYIINLATGDEFWAEKGNGSFFNGETIEAQNDDIFYAVSYEASHPKSDIPKILNLISEARRTRCFGATALDLAYLAYGAISVFVTPSLSRSFDFGGGWLLVKEAGGILTNIEGRPLDKLEISLKRSSSLLAAGNKDLHEKALRIIG
jgi:myo-inositol-1(or 4)-monophosphatase